VAAQKSPVQSEVNRAVASVPKPRVDMKEQSLRDTFLLRPEERTGTHLTASPNDVGPGVRLGQMVPEWAMPPYWPNAGMEDHVRPAARRAGIGKRLGWHTLRHTFGTLIKSQGTDVATTQALMRHANASITLDRYVQAVTPAKREAQSRIVQSIPFPFVPTRLTGTVANA